MGANGNEIVVEFDCGSQQFADCAAAIIKVRERGDAVRGVGWGGGKGKGAFFRPLRS